MHLNRFRKPLDQRCKQLVGSQYAFTKRAEIEVLSYMRGDHVQKDKRAAAVGVLTRSKKPTK